MKEQLNVTELVQFISLDGWIDDPEKTKKLYVGKAIIDFAARTGSDGDLEPVKKRNNTPRSLFRRVKDV